jgi:hypothetical protein
VGPEKPVGNILAENSSRIFSTIFRRSGHRLKLYSFARPDAALQPPERVSGVWMDLGILLKRITEGIFVTGWNQNMVTNSVSGNFSGSFHSSIFHRNKEF